MTATQVHYSPLARRREPTPRSPYSTVTGDPTPGPQSRHTAQTELKPELPHRPTVTVHPVSADSGGAPSTLTSSVGEIITSLYWPSEGFFRLALPQWHSVHKVLDFGRAATRDRTRLDFGEPSRPGSGGPYAWFKQLQLPVPVT